MATGLFISYRRKDTRGWAGHLFENLAREFGAAQIFMDIAGSIRRGERFDEAIQQALGNCEVLLALIGPDWLSCTRSDGTRRLDVADDWVRKEIVTALQRQIPIVPVLLGQAGTPDVAQLPEEMRGLMRHQIAELADNRWPDDVEKLVDDLTTLTSLRRLKTAVNSAESGLRLLKELTGTNPAVADAVGRSREVVETTHRQLSRLEAFKCVHDALHTIEIQCLRAMQASGFTASVRQYRAQFVAEKARIDEALKGDTIHAGLRDDLVDRLSTASAGFDALLASRAKPEWDQVLAELTVLLSRLPSQLDEGMVAAAADLRLDRLIGLMEVVQGQLAQPGTEPREDLKPLWAAVDALKQLRVELKLRVDEHTQLQRVDSALRVVCEGGVAGAIGAEWARIKRTRSRLVPPHSPELAVSVDDLLALEADIDARVIDDAPKAHAMIVEYFQVVGTAFRSADRGLLKLSGRLSQVSKPLESILTV